MDHSQSTKWPQLGDPEFYSDVTITRAKYSYEKKEKDVSLRMERYYEEYAMGLVDNEDDVTIDKILLKGDKKVTLIEGDPGSGKTTLTLQICKQWAEGKLLSNCFLVLMPLRCYELLTNANDLFEVFEKLGCRLPGMKEYAQQNDGDGLVLILDGWDELPNQLQIKSLFSDIVFSKNSMFHFSTIIVTSRPSCSEKIAKVVQQRNAHYQILGFSPHNSELYIKRYFNNDLQSAELLIDMLKGREYLRRHFYIPITVTIMCFVYSHSDDSEIPETLSKLYEHFVLLYICSNVPDTCRKDIKEFNTLSDVPKILQPLFGKLCKTAYDMLRDKKLVFDEDVLGITNSDLKTLDLDPQQFDGLGLLHVEYFPTKWATTKRSYSFIHRAVQELLAGIFILDTGNISDILDEHFYEGSYLINMFPFLFGLESKELLRPLAGKLIQIFNKSNRDDQLLLSILYCLFEAHDETLCREFGQVFSEKRHIKLRLHTLLNCHYACYFITVCGIKRLNVNIVSGNVDLCYEIIAKYLNTSTDIASFYFHVLQCKLSHKGMEHFAKALSTQPNILSVKLIGVCEPDCVSILCDNICKHNTQIINLGLFIYGLTENNLESIGSVLTTLPLESLYVRLHYSLSEGICLDSSLFFYKGLCETKLLHTLFLWGLSQADSKVFGNIISQNCSLKELCIKVATADCLDPILNRLLSNTSITTFKAWPDETSASNTLGLCRLENTNTSITTFKAWPDETSASNTLGQCLEKCLILNHSLNIVDFTSSPHNTQLKYVSWSPTQVSSICTGLCANTTVVTLDISGCYIDTDACHAVCGMLSQNTTLQHLFLNPVHLEKQQAIVMIDSCRANATLELLSLVKWPPKMPWVNNQGKDQFQYSCDPEINHVLLKIQKLRQDKDKPLLSVYWLVAIYIVLMCCYLILYV